VRTVSGKEKMEGDNGTMKGIEIQKRSEKVPLFGDIDMSDIDADGSNQLELID
jgi:hypothetical protein